MGFVTISLEVDESKLASSLNQLLDDATRTEIANIVAELCDPYVPYDTGNLAEASRTVDANGIHYNADYAEKQYYGVEFHHKTDAHPLATALWDKVMLSEQGDVLRARVEEVLVRRAKQLYG